MEEKAAGEPAANGLKKHWRDPIGETSIWIIKIQIFKITYKYPTYLASLWYETLYVIDPNLSLANANKKITKKNPRKGTSAHTI